MSNPTTPLRGMAGLAFVRRPSVGPSLRFGAPPTGSRGFAARASPACLRPHIGSDASTGAAPHDDHPARRTGPPVPDHHRGPAPRFGARWAGPVRCPVAVARRPRWERRAARGHRHHPCYQGAGERLTPLPFPSNPPPWSGDQGGYPFALCSAKSASGIGGQVAADTGEGSAHPAYASALIRACRAGLPPPLFKRQKRGDRTPHNRYSFFVQCWFVNHLRWCTNQHRDRADEAVGAAQDENRGGKGSNG
uniref:Uncharacterized protein n=1 Tax=uncultured prokaryote TaxID=198431 RepID=A0A0H5QG09_9ZZZZ|nr:hypothetical protein [uncultured prokaryote]